MTRRNGPGASAVKPLVRWVPQHGWMPLNLGELWSFRDLFLHLAARNVKVRYKQTTLGILWALLQPLFTMIIFTLLFGRLAKIPSNGLPYPVFAYTGILLWSFFSSAATSSANSLVGSASLITKVYFPRMLIPASYIGSALVDFAIAFSLLVALMIWYQVPVTLAILASIPIVAVVIVMALAIGLGLGALNVRYRDIQYTIPFLVQLWMFASPVIYPVSMIPKKWQWVLRLNPMTGPIENFRWALLGRPDFDGVSLVSSAAIAVISLVAAALVFRRMEDYFADLV